MRNQEYDAFGPWIYEIGGEHCMPPLFVSYFDQQDDHDILIKIPVNKERRDLSPGMHLYNYVVGLYPKYLYIMKRVEDIVETSTVEYGSIMGVTHSVRLLHGQLTVYTDSSMFQINYNTSSQDIIENIISVIRKKSAGQSTDRIMFPQHPVTKISYGLTNILEKMKELDPETKVIAYQSEKRLQYTASFPVRRLFNFFLKPRLLESLILTNGIELQFVLREDGFSYRDAKSYELSFFYMPVHRVSEIVLVPSKRFKNLIEICIQLSIHQFLFHVDEKSSAVDFFNQIKANLNLK